jgi:predicted RNA binding protein YcfA (HicA-like mRNA interferase family)
VPILGPIKHRKLIRNLRQLGFEGPFAGGKHPFMVKGNVTITVPNPHGRDIGRELLKRILRQAGISREEWENLK